MSSVKKIAVCVLASGALCASVTAMAQAARVLVNDEPTLDIVAPDTQTPGFSYVTTGTTSQVNVNTAGFLFCANVPAGAGSITLAPQHVRWTLPMANDVESMGYAGSTLKINKPGSGLSTETSLVCRVRGPQGDIYSPFSAYGEAAFRDGFEPFADVQYGNLINWKPTREFNWSQPDWADVPTDPCNFDLSLQDTPTVSEESLCVAATGVRPVAGGDSPVGVRAATMWTQSVGSNFIYLARIDGRLGPQATGPNLGFSTGATTDDTAGSPNSVTTQVRDAFDSRYLTASGSYCFLTSLPSSLTTHVCDGAPVGGSLSENVNGGVVTDSFALSLIPSSPTASFYVAVIRTINPNDPPTISTPIAAMAVMTDPGTMRSEAGDGFTGDDVIFGFPGDGSFPWMSGQ